MLKFSLTHMRNKKGQITGEAALLLALVVAACIAMQTYVQRSLQARQRDASQYMTSKTTLNQTAIGNTDQYEPYYLKSSYDISKESSETTKLGAGLSAKSVSSNRTRDKAGYQESTYSATSGEKTGH